MNSWLEIEEFSALVNLDVSAVEAMIEEGKLASKNEEDKCYVEVSRSAQALNPSTQGIVLNEDMGGKNSWGHFKFT